MAADYYLFGLDFLARQASFLVQVVLSKIEKCKPFTHNIEVSNSPRATGLWCTSFGNVPSPFGDFVLLTYYCSQAHLETDWPNHKEHCLAARERALFGAAEALQRRYYIACDMSLEGTMKGGYNMCTMVHYDRDLLQRQINAVAGCEEDRKVLLACSEGYNPMLSRRDGLRRHLKGE